MIISLSFIIYIVVLYFAYAYFKSMNECKCVNATYAERLKNVEVVFLGFNVIGLLLSMMSAMHILPILKAYKEHLLKFVMVGSLVMLAFYSYFLYNTYYFVTSMETPCPCADKWQKYYVYVQVFTTCLIILSTAFYSGLAGFGKLPVQDVGERFINNVLGKVQDAVHLTSKRSRRSASASARSSSSRSSSSRSSSA